MKKYLPVLGILLLCILLYYVATWVLEGDKAQGTEGAGEIAEGEKSLYAGPALWLGATIPCFTTTKKRSPALRMPAAPFGYPTTMP